MWIFLATLLLHVASTHVGADPKFISNAGHHYARVGQTVSLPCEVYHLGDYVVMWRKEAEILSAADKVITNENEYHYEVLVTGTESDMSNWTLLIKSVEGIDEGNYHCSLTTNPEMELVHHLNVKVPPSVNMIPDVSLSPHAVLAGDSIKANCDASGNPRPIVVWSRVGGDLFPNGQPQMTTNYLLIENASAKYGGDYVCTASNGEEPEAKALITFQVVSPNEPNIAPKIFNITTGPVHVTVGGSFNISCKYTASPHAIVKWYRNNEQLLYTLMSGDEKFDIVNRDHHEYKETTLIYRNISSDEYGEYKCKFHNGHGDDEGTIHVTGFPVVEDLQVEQMDKGVLFSWVIDSIEPIDEYLLEYRKSEHDEFQNLTSQTSNISPGPSENNVTYKGSYLVDTLDPETEYKFRMRARNKNGWSHQTMEEKTFITHPKGVPESLQPILPVDTEKPSEEDERKKSNEKGEDAKVKDEKPPGNGSYKFGPFGAMLFVFSIFSIARIFKST